MKSIPNARITVTADGRKVPVVVKPRGGSGQAKVVLELAHKGEYVESLTIEAKKVTWDLVAVQIKLPDGRILLEHRVSVFS